MEGDSKSRHIDEEAYTAMAVVSLPNEDNKGNKNLVAAVTTKPQMYVYEVNQDNTQLFPLAVSR